MYVTAVSLYIMYTPTCFDNSVFILLVVTRQTNTPTTSTRDCMCSHQYTHTVAQCRTDFIVSLNDNQVIFISVINQLDAQNFCFTIRLFHASTCFEHRCSKHVEAWNKRTVKKKICASSWLITEINVLRCTVSKMAKLSNSLMHFII